MTLFSVRNMRQAPKGLKIAAMPPPMYSLRLLSGGGS